MNASGDTTLPLCRCSVSVVHRVIRSFRKRTKQNKQEINKLFERVFFLPAAAEGGSQRLKGGQKVD